MNRGFHKVLGLWPGNQHGGRDAKREPVELLLCQNVLDRLMLCAAVKPLLVDGLLLRPNLRVWMDQEKAAIFANGLAQQKFGVKPRVGQISEPFRSACERVGDADG